jgi:lipopolysaccharide transport system permease protein
MMSGDYEITLKPPTSWPTVDLASIWRYRDLLSLLVWRDFVSKYKQTALGPLWFVVQPVLMTLVFTVVFGNVVGLSTDGLPSPLFYMCGQLGWNYFAQTLGANSSTLVANAALFGKVYFPRLVVPLSALISNLVAFGIQFATFAVFYAYYKYAAPAGSFGVGLYAALLPLLLVHMALLSLGVSLVLSALTTKYRDLTHATPLLIQVWLYATPVIYPLSQFPADWRWAAALNPMTSVVELFRLTLLGTGTVETSHVAWSVGCTAVFLIAGLMLFARVEKSFVDTV